jgi:hypothetical protein
VGRNSDLSAVAKRRRKRIGPRIQVAELAAQR